jgi:hypothetical protein
VTWRDYGVRYGQRSRTTVNGPTVKDNGQRSTVNGQRSTVKDYGQRSRTTVNGPTVKDYGQGLRSTVNGTGNGPTVNGTGNGQGLRGLKEGERSKTVPLFFTKLPSPPSLYVFTTRVTLVVLGSQHDLPLANRTSFENRLALHLSIKLSVILVVVP